MLLRRSFIAAVLTFGVAISALSAVQVGEGKDATAIGKRIEKSLGGLAKGDGDWKRFSVTYDDFHAFHGGLTLTIHGTGKVKQRATGRAGEEKKVSKTELKRLVALLIKHKAWEQRVVERPAGEDESKARVVIKYGDDSVTVWEWYNDLRENKRLLEIREEMKKAAWKSIPKE